MILVFGLITFVLLLFIIGQYIFNFFYFFKKGWFFIFAILLVVITFIIFFLADSLVLPLLAQFPENQLNSSTKSLIKHSYRCICFTSFHLGWYYRKRKKYNTKVTS
jgi:hypothetical protein